MSTTAMNPLSATSGIPGLPPLPVAATAAKAKAAAAAAGGSTGTAAAGDANKALGPTSSAADQSNRFLKLLVAQMSNQDPLNPMDSAQVTSQMAQISTVEGVQTLNTTVSGLNGQFAQLQAMQGASLVGREVAIAGNSVHVDADTHQADGGFQIDTPATDVQVDILNPAGQSVGTVRLGAQDAGRHSFSWDVPEAQRGQALTFKVTAMNNASEVDSKPLAYGGISAVSTAGGKLSLELDNGKSVGYDDVQAFL
ncbi:MAG: flagellar hook assembly protein FlgD [Burkholderiaceae bacterium]